MYFDTIRLNGASDVDLAMFGAGFNDRFILKAVDGLGPTEIDVHLSDSAVQGGVYQGRRSRNRELVIRIGLNPLYSVNETPAELRSILYGLLVSRKNVPIEVQLMADNDIIVYTSGWIKKLETVMFSKEPEVQITIACDEPYWKAIETIEIPLPIPYYNPFVDYIGTAPAGFHMDLTFTVAFQYFVLNQDGTGAEDTVMTVGNPIWAGFEVDDHMVIETSPGSRSIVYTRDAVEINALHLLASTSTWPMLNSGANQFYLYPPTDIFEWNSISYTPHYWGV